MEDNIANSQNNQVGCSPDLIVNTQGVKRALGGWLNHNLMQR